MIIRLQIVCLHNRSCTYINNILNKYLPLRSKIVHSMHTAGHYIVQSRITIDDNFVKLASSNVVIFTFILHFIVRKR